MVPFYAEFPRKYFGMIWKIMVKFKTQNQNESKNELQRNPFRQN
jgi:hypothetical protein